jgi:predicted metallopeptidase
MNSAASIKLHEDILNEYKRLDFAESEKNIKELVNKFKSNFIDNDSRMWISSKNNQSKSTTMIYQLCIDAGVYSEDLTKKEIVTPNQVDTYFNKFLNKEQTDVMMKIFECVMRYEMHKISDKTAEETLNKYIDENFETIFLYYMKNSEHKMGAIRYLLDDTFMGTFKHFLGRYIEERHSSVIEYLYKNEDILSIILIGTLNNFSFESTFDKLKKEDINELNKIRLKIIAEKD